MATTVHCPLEEYLEMRYRFTVTADEESGYVIEYPDLPGCMTQVETLEEIPAMAEDARRGWLQTAYEQGLDIPLPGRPEEYSGKFLARVPKSLHRTLAEEAKREGVSLNQYVLMLLSGRHAAMQA